MPLWHIHHSPNVFSYSQKKDLARVVADRYESFGLPRFYVVVIFHETAADDFFIGGESTSSAVRVIIEHIARQHPDSASRRRAARWIRDLIAPFVEQSGVHWEFHVDETSDELWMINGLAPPSGGSDAEKAWAAANAAVPYE